MPTTMARRVEMGSSDEGAAAAGSGLALVGVARTGEALRTEDLAGEALTGDALAGDALAGDALTGEALAGVAGAEEVCCLVLDGLMGRRVLERVEEDEEDSGLLILTGFAAARSGIRVGAALGVSSNALGGGLGRAAATGCWRLGAACSSTKLVW